MWLPKSVYERLPQIWLLVGLLFMSSGLYLGFSYPLTKFYYATGLLCSLWSLCVFTQRLHNRPVPEHKERAAEAMSRRRTNVMLHVRSPHGH